jgi:hypothetical protein
MDAVDSSRDWSGSAADVRDVRDERCVLTGDKVPIKTTPTPDSQEGRKQDLKSNIHARLYCMVL